MNDPPSVTLIVVNWNSGELLAKCLGTVAQLTVQPDVLVIDNNSSDGSAEFADGLKNVTLVRMEENLGFAAANNYAIEKADTEFVALLNPDAFPEPNWLKSLLDAARNHPEFDAFGSRQLKSECPEYLDGVGDIYHISGLMWRDRHGVRLSSGDLESREIFSPCAAGALYRRHVIQEIGGFDEDFFCYVEDVDLGFRLRLSGRRALYVPDAIVHHVGSATSGGHKSHFTIYHGHRNMVWVFMKNMPSPLFWLLLPLHLGVNLMAIAWYSCSGHRRIILKAKWDAIKGVTGAWRKRRGIQQRRIAPISDLWRVLDKRLSPKRG